MKKLKVGPFGEKKISKKMSHRAENTLWPGNGRLSPKCKKRQLSLETN